MTRHLLPLTCLSLLLPLDACSGGGTPSPPSREPIAPAPARSTAPIPRARPTPPVPGVLDAPGITFLVAADTHFGFKGLESWNLAKVKAMNALPGKRYPKAMGGRVDRPLGVLVAGDLTQSGHAWQWKQFVKLYGHKGGDGLLSYPVFEATGNHDYYGKRRHVAQQVARRHGGLRYAWSWHGVHFVCLDTHPQLGARRWLLRRLKRIGARAPIVIYFHYSIVGPYSQWWSDKAKKAFRKAIRGYNVIAIFHGHFHASFHYRWEGLDVYNVGSPLYNFPTFAVAKVTATHLVVNNWNYERERWDWHHTKKLRLGPDPKLLPPRPAQKAPPVSTRPAARRPPGRR